MRYRSIVTLGIAAALCSPLAHATSPELPVMPRLEVASKKALDGEAAVRLVLETQVEGEFAVTVRRHGIGSSTDKAMAAAGTAIAADVVMVDAPMVVHDSVASMGTDVVHVRYEIEVVSSDGSYHGLVAVAQTFAVGLDGTLEPIDFREEMLRLGSPVGLSEGDEPAGGPSAQPE